MSADPEEFSASDLDSFESNSTATLDDIGSPRLVREKSAGR